MLNNIAILVKRVKSNKFEDDRIVMTLCYSIAIWLEMSFSNGMYSTLVYLLFYVVLAYLQISLNGNNLDHHSMLTNEYARMQCSVFNNVSLSGDERYTVSSGAMNILGLAAAPVNISFTVILTRPSLTCEFIINDTEV